MDKLRIGNVVIATLHGLMAIYALNDFECMNPDSYQLLGTIADGSDGTHVIEVLGGYYDAVAPVDGWEVAFQDVIVMARLFCIPEEKLLAA